MFVEELSYNHICCSFGPSYGTIVKSSIHIYIHASNLQYELIVFALVFTGYIYILVEISALPCSLCCGYLPIRTLNWPVNCAIGEAPIELRWKAACTGGDHEGPQHNLTVRPSRLR